MNPCNVEEQIKKICIMDDNFPTHAQKVSARPYSANGRLFQTRPRVPTKTDPLGRPVNYSNRLISSDKFSSDKWNTEEENLNFLSSFDGEAKLEKASSKNKTRKVALRERVIDWRKPAKTRPQIPQRTDDLGRLINISGRVISQHANRKTKPKFRKAGLRIENAQPDNISDISDASIQEPETESQDEVVEPFEDLSPSKSNHTQGFSSVWNMGIGCNDWSLIEENKEEENVVERSMSPVDRIHMKKLQEIHRQSKSRLSVEQSLNVNNVNLQRDTWTSFNGNEHSDYPEYQPVSNVRITRLENSPQKDTSHSSAQIDNTANIGALQGGSPSDSSVSSSQRRRLSQAIENALWNRQMLKEFYDADVEQQSQDVNSHHALPPPGIDHPVDPDSGAQQRDEAELAKGEGGEGAGRVVSFQDDLIEMVVDDQLFEEDEDDSIVNREFPASPGPGYWSRVVEEVGGDWDLLLEMFVREKRRRSTSPSSHPEDGKTEGKSKKVRKSSKHRPSLNERYQAYVDKKIAAMQEKEEAAREEAERRRRVGTVARKGDSETERLLQVLKQEKLVDRMRLRALLRDPVVKNALLSAPAGADVDTLVHQLRRAKEDFQKPVEGNFGLPPIAQRSLAVVGAPVTTLAAAGPPITVRPRSEQPLPARIDRMAGSNAVTVPPPPNPPPLSAYSGSLLPMRNLENVQEITGELTKIDPSVNTLKLEMGVIYDRDWEDSHRKVYQKLPMRQATLINMPPEEVKKKIKAFSASSAPDLLSLQSRHSLQAEFIRRYCINVTCLLFDFRMQLLGSFSMDSINRVFAHEFPHRPFVPGLKMDLDLKQSLQYACRRVLSKGTLRMDGALLYRQVLPMIELDLKALPEHIFAVTFLVSDDSLISLSPPDTWNEHEIARLAFQELKLECSLYSDELTYKHQAQSNSGKLSASDQTHGLISLEDNTSTSSFSRQDDSSDAISDVQPDGPPKKIWSKLIGACGNRKLNPNAIVPNSEHQLSFGPGGAFVPYVIFRRHSAAAGWALKPLNASIERAHPLNQAIEATVSTMIRHNVFPVHVVHIEHCKDCHLHAMTTKHVPGMYEARAMDLKTSLTASLPPTMVFVNRPGMMSVTPRLGAFEVHLQLYHSNIIQKIYSKSRFGNFPTDNEIIESMSTMLLPDKGVFHHPPVLRLSVMDGYYRDMVPETHVWVYRVKVRFAAPVALEELVIPRTDNKLVIAAEENSLATSDDSDDNRDEEKSGVDGSGIFRVHSIEERKKSIMTAFSQLLHPPSSHHHHSGNRRSSEVVAETGEKEQKARKPYVPITPLTRLLRSKDIEDAALRRSVGFLRVRTWSQLEVSQWFNSYELPPRVLSNAIASGVVDGASFIAFTNEENLVAWGVRSRVVLKQMLASLKSLREELIAYDPWISSNVERSLGSSNPFLKGVPSAHSNAVVYERISEGIVSNNGKIDFEFQTTGTYFFVACGRNKEPFYSPAFHVDTSSPRDMECTALVNPLVGRMRIRITRPPIHWLEDVQLRPLYGFELGAVMTFYCLATGRRIPVIARPVDSTAIDPVEFAKNNKFARLLLKRRRNANYYKKTPRGIVMTNPTTSRRSSMSGESLLFNPLKELEVEFFLPVGRYRSGVDGRIIHILSEHDDDERDESGDSDESEDDVDIGNETATQVVTEVTDDESESSSKARERFLALQQVRKKSFLYRRLVREMSNDGIFWYRPKTDHLAIVYDADSAYECHMRLMTRTAVILQRIYRRWKAAFLLMNRDSVAIIYRCCRKLLEKVRSKIRQREFRKVMARKRIRKKFLNMTVFKERMIRFVAHVRRKLALIHVEKRKRYRGVLLRALHRYVHWRRQKRKAAILLQSFMRVFLSKRRFERAVLTKRWRRLSRLSAERGQEMIFRMQEVKSIAERNRKEESSKLSEQLAEAFRIQRMRQAALEESQRRNAAAIRLQSLWRAQKNNWNRALSKVKKRIRYKSIVKEIESIVPPLEKFVNSVASKLLAKFALKLQKFYRMHRVRMVYLAMRMMNGLGEGRSLLYLRELRSGHYLKRGKGTLSREESSKNFRFGSDSVLKPSMRKTNSTQSFASHHSDKAPETNKPTPDPNHVGHNSASGSDGKESATQVHRFPALSKNLSQNKEYEGESQDSSAQTAPSTIKAGIEKEPLRKHYRKDDLVASTLIQDEPDIPVYDEFSRPNVIPSTVVGGLGNRAKALEPLRGDIYSALRRKYGSSLLRGMLDTHGEINSISYINRHTTLIQGKAQPYNSEDRPLQG